MEDNNMALNNSRSVAKGQADTHTEQAPTVARLTKDVDVCSCLCTETTGRNDCVYAAYTG